MASVVTEVSHLSRHSPQLSLSILNSPPLSPLLHLPLPPPLPHLHLPPPLPHFLIPSPPWLSLLPSPSFILLLLHSMMHRRQGLRWWNRWRTHYWVVSYILDFRLLTTRTSSYLASYSLLLAIRLISCSQALDEEYLKVDAQFGGEDQRKIFTFAEKVRKKIWAVCDFGIFVVYRIFHGLGTRNVFISWIQWVSESNWGREKGLGWL